VGRAQRRRAREEEPSVAVYSTIDGVRKQVWGYPESACAHPRPDHRLVEVFGFDPVNWQVPPDTVNDHARLRAQETPAPPTPSLAVLAAAALVPEVAAPAPAAVGGAWLGLRAELHRLWDDRFARGLLLAGVVSLWLAVTLGEPALLAPTAAAGAAIAWRRRRQPTAAGHGDDEWF
jgi:hypothetical protein